MRRTTLLLATLVVGVMLAGPAAADPPEGNAPHGHAHGASDPGLGAQLAAVRAATARYHDVAVAEADGYVQLTPCLQDPVDGTMGYHYIKPALVPPAGSTDELDPTAPQALLYVPEDERLRLVSVEFITPNEGASLFGQPFHLGPAGYALHVWLWANNPAGMFADWNPALSC